MIRRIAVPLDGSSLAEAVLPVVAAVSRITGASVTLLRVVEPPPAHGSDADPSTPAIDRDLVAADERVARAYLTGLNQRLSRDGDVIQARVVIGEVAATIRAIAGEFDLLAMATHARGGLDRWMHGSVADGVVRGATTPVLLVRAAPSGPPALDEGFPRRVLVPLDGSELAEHVLPLAMDLASSAGATLVLMRGTNWAAVSAGINAYPVGGASPYLFDMASEAAHDYLRVLAQRLGRAGVRVVTDVRVEPPADGILAAVADQHADLIVMSTHGRGGLGRWVHGSVADQVLHQATVPIIVARPEACVGEEIPVGGGQASIAGRPS
jgi:nucleotide-binding universal stress UspA family protein